MAGYESAGSAAGEHKGNDRRASQMESEAASEQKRLAGLPGVVNDLPEVAPHEWIYLMS